MKNESAEKLKILQTRLDAVRLEIDQATKSRSNINQRIDALTRQKDKIEYDIKQAGENSKEVIISEHALLRYLEGAMDVDLDAVKKVMLTESLIASITSLHNGIFPMKHGVRAVVKNNVIVTIED